MRNVTHPHSDSRGVEGSLLVTNKWARSGMPERVVTSNSPAAEAGNGALGMNHQGSGPASKASRTTSSISFTEGKMKVMGKGAFAPNCLGGIWILESSLIHK